MSLLDLSNNGALTPYRIGQTNQPISRCDNPLNARNFCNAIFVFGDDRLKVAAKEEVLRYLQQWIFG